MRSLFMMMLLLCIISKSHGQFITTWQTTSKNESITIPTHSSEIYSYDINWGDGTIDFAQTGDATHTYVIAGTYTVQINGKFPRIYINNGANKDKILSIEQWGNIQWTSMAYAFRGCTNLQVNASDAPDLSDVTSLTGTFQDASSFNADLNHWNVATIIGMTDLFNGATNFNGNISSWDVDNVTSMSRMFMNTNFNQNISAWNTSSLQFMGDLFNGTPFNQDVSSWDVSGVTFMPRAFKNTDFNQDISTWNVSSVISMEELFSGVSNFNQNLADWNVTATTNMSGIFANTALSVSNYDSILISWSALSLQSGVSFGAAGLKYCNASTERQAIIDNFGWTITDAGQSCPFITTWQTTTSNESITIPTTGTGYNYSINWGDGAISSGLTGDATHTFATAGTYRIEILGDFPRIYFNNTGDKDKILTVAQWGEINWSNMSNAFRGCSMLTITATDAPDLSSCTSTANMFEGCAVMNKDISHWDISTITTLASMFKNANSFDQNLGNWNISSVSAMNNLFDNTALSACNYDSILMGWASQSVQNGVSLGAAGIHYCTASTSQQDLIDSDNWSINDAGQHCPFTTIWQTTSANESITIPTNSSFTYNYEVNWGDGTIESGLTGDASHTYATAGNYIIEISGTFPSIYFNNSGDVTKIIAVKLWGENSWSSMNGAFYGCTNLAINATDAPDLSSCSSTAYMFADCELVNVSLNDWDVSSITDMTAMFTEASTFNGDISGWNTSNVESMELMFYRASNFNVDISSWNTSKVTSMWAMFTAATDFNQAIGTWDVSAVTNMESVLNGARAFTHSLEDWDISNVTNLKNALNNTILSVYDYDKTLLAWSSLTLQSGVTFGARNLNYCDAATARQVLIDNFGWTITDEGSYCPYFITTWQTSTADETITIPTTGSGYDYSVNWGDGTFESGLTGSATHTFSTAGTYTVQILGNFPRIYFNNSGDKTKILTIEQWGNIEWSSMVDAFRGCSNLQINASDAPDLSGVTFLNRMFQDAVSLNADLNNWDVSTITSTADMFKGASAFNGKISNWNVSNINGMAGMFMNSNFNQDIGAWNTSNVQFMGNLFNGSLFNQDISGWDVSKVIFMNNTFKNSDFNQNLGDWNVSAVTNMTNMLNNTPISTINYDSTLIGWSALSLQNGVSLGANNLKYCLSETQRQHIIDTYGWTISNDEANCTDYGFITTWQTSEANESITIPTNSNLAYDYQIDWGDGTEQTGRTGDASHTYATAGTYIVKIYGDFPAIYFNNTGDKDNILSIEQWGLIEWDSMHNAFYGCTNLALNATDVPDLSKVTNVSNMFRDASNFNGAIGTWDMSTIQVVDFMFSNASSFNQDISSWDVSNVTSMAGTFQDASSFNQDLSSWNVSTVTTMNDLFNGAAVFNQSLGDWDISKVSNLSGMLDNAGLLSSNYDATLTGWSALTLNNTLTLGAANLNYCEAAPQRQAIINNFGWTITDAGQFCPFIITMAASGSITSSTTIPTNPSYTYNYTVDWGDGSVDRNITGDATHQYQADGTYTIEVTGTFPAIYFNDGGDKASLHTIEQWGDVEWKSMENAFYGCRFFDIAATDAPDLSTATSLFRAFKDGYSITNPDLTNWDVSTITNMGLLFGDAYDFNGNVSTWNVGNVTNMYGLFSNCQDFAGDVSNWNVSKVTNMGGMFFGCNKFNSDLSSWNVGQVTSFAQMFQLCPIFNQAIGNWDVSKVSNFNYMFTEASAFNQDLSNWDLSAMNQMIDFLDNSGLTTDNYDQFLISLSSQSLSSNVTFGASSLSYCQSYIEHQKLINEFGWTMEDGGLDASCSTVTIWDGSSWSNKTPTSGMITSIEGDYDTDIDGSLISDALLVNDTYTLTVRSGNSVEIAGDLTNYGSIIVQGNTSFVQTASSPSNSGTGTYTVEKGSRTSQDIYNYWSSPVQNTSIANVFGSNGTNFYQFNAATQNWQTATTSSNLTAGTGFTATGADLANNSITRSFSDNTGFNSGTITISPTFDGTSGDPDKNWNLIGNPYPSGLDVAQFLDDNKSVIENAVYLWSSDGNDTNGTAADYATMNSAGTVNAGGSGVAPSSATISSCQGFFVQTWETGDITFNNDQRVRTNNTFQRTTQQGSRIWLTATLEGIAENEILLGFFEDGEWETDGYDATKLSGNSHISFYSLMGNSPLAIQGLPELSDEMSIPLGLDAKSAGIFSFNISKLDGFDAATAIYLYDSETEELVDLRVSSYTLELPEGNYDSRFLLRIIPSRVTAIADLTEDVGITIYSSAQQVHIHFTDIQAAKSEIIIYDIMGKVLTKQNNEHELVKAIDIPKSGVWVVQVSNSIGKVVKKVFITY